MNIEEQMAYTAKGLNVGLERIREITEVQDENGPKKISLFRVVFSDFPETWPVGSVSAWDLDDLETGWI